MTSEHLGAQEQPDQEQAQERADQQFVREHQDELSPSAQRAKWIHDTDEREDYAGQPLATRSRAVIRQWAEQRKATPATEPAGQAGQGGQGTDERVLRFDFPDAQSGALQPVSWDEFFQIFDERELVFHFQQHMTAGEVSDLCRFELPAGGEA